MSRLGMLPRLGVVLTLLWLAGATFYYATKESREWVERTEFVRTFCASVAPNSDAVKKCDSKADDSYKRLSASNLVRDSFGFSLMIASLAWVVIGMTIFASRWVLAGGRAQ